MVDPETYVTGDSIDFFGLVSALVSSFLLAWYSGAADFLYAVLKVPADLLSAGLGWTADTLGLGFEVPQGSLETSWEYAADFFPVSGPFDWIVGVVLILVFFHAVVWMIGRVQEGI